jgi:tetratricopeptide (TPR) repeat protein
VIYFPKKPKAPPVVGRFTATLPEVRTVVEEEVTEAEVAVVPEPRGTPQVRRAAPEKKRRRTKETPLAESSLAAVVGQGRKTPQEVADLSLFGHQLFELGRVEEARVIFERLVSTGAKDAFAHTMLGTIYLALKDQTRALALFQLALEIDPNDLSALVYRGEIRLNRGKLKGALDDLTQALKIGAEDDPFVDRAARLVKMAKGLLKRARR